MTQPEELLTTKEVADILRVQPATVRIWARTKGGLRTVRTVGGHYRFPKDSVYELLNGTVTGPWEREEEGIDG